MIVPLMFYKPFLYRHHNTSGIIVLDTRSRVCSVGAKQMYFAEELIRSMDKLGLVNEEDP